jgi:uncharacterized protein YkwD
VGRALLSTLLFAVVACAPDRQPDGDLVALINERRAESGCPAVARDDALSAAALRHAVDMRDNGVRDHAGSDGSSAADRITDAGFGPARATGEILYWSEGRGDAGQAVAGWMGSADHREIIQTCGFTHIGVGVLEPPGGGYIAVADFAASGAVGGRR